MAYPAPNGLTLFIRSRKIYFLILAFLIIHSGAIRKNYDAIVDTQTETVLWKQLEEQIKDGEKAAPTPSFKFYANESFQLKSPVAGTQSAASQAAGGNSMLGSGLPEDVKGSASESSEENWWMESWQDPGAGRDESETWAGESASLETHAGDQSSEAVEEKKKPASEFWEENW